MSKRQTKPVCRNNADASSSSELLWTFPLPILRQPDQESVLSMKLAIVGLLLLATVSIIIIYIIYRGLGRAYYYNNSLLFHVGQC